jgi:DNA-binding PadR family transcriptional regulator
MYITCDVITSHVIVLRTIKSMKVRLMAEVGLHRFSDPSLLILASLAGSAKHGYAMMEDIEHFAGLRLGPGTLYGALARLEAAGLIEPLPSEERRRPYRLTSAGIMSLQDQLSQLERFASMGLQRLASR